jgi:pyruvate/2-oxoglutarate dehydrogenase complex dihydrolipoamide dehydrogenase (E3) component
MSESEHFEILILGSGAGGKLLAWAMGRAGRRVAVVERQWVGGACPNIACLPSKNEVASARVAHLARHAGEFGTSTGAVVTDMKKVRERKRRMVEDEVAFHLKAYKDSGVELVMGSGRFLSAKTLEVSLNGGGRRVLTGDQVVVNVGTHAMIPNVAGLEAVRPLTHIEALELDRVPEHLIVLGGGYVGLEMAQTFSRFGSRVTVIESGHQLMAREDSDIADAMREILEKEGIRFLLSAEVRNVEGRSGDAVKLSVRTPAGEQLIEGSDLLVAAGRIPNTAGIGLEQAGVELDARGCIRVDDRLETGTPGVWAVGECAGSPFFTHVSADDFRIVMANMGGGNRSTRDRLVPYCVFTDPPLARVGLNEREAQGRGIATRVARLPMGAVLRTAATGEKAGFMKVLVGARDDRILGFTMLGSEAGEVTTTMQMAMIAEMPYTRIRDAVITHLTMAEGLGPLLSNVQWTG